METVAFMTAMPAASAAATLAILWRVDLFDKTAAIFSGFFCAYATHIVLRVLTREGITLAAHAEVAALAAAISLLFLGAVHLTDRRVSARVIAIWSLALFAAMIGLSFVGDDPIRTARGVPIALVVLVGVLPPCLIFMTTNMTGLTGVLRTVGLTIAVLAVMKLYLAATGPNIGVAGGFEFVAFTLNIVLLCGFIVLVLRRRTSASEMPADPSVASGAHAGAPDSGFDFSWETDADGRLTGLSPNFETLYGVHPASVKGRLFSQFASPWPSADKLDDPALIPTSGLPFRDRRIRIADAATGAGHVVSLSGNPVIGRDGTVTAIRGIGCNLTEEAQVQGILQTMVERTIRFSGQKYLQQMVACLVELLRMDIGVIGEISSDGSKINIRALRDRAGLVDVSTYEVANSPCERALNRGHYAIARDVQDAFPQDIDLRRMNIAGYIGVALGDPGKTPLGLLVLLSREPIGNLGIASALTRLVATRVTKEFGRAVTEERLRSSETLFRTVIDQLPFAVALKDLDNRYLMANRTYCAWTGVDRDWIVGRDMRGIADRFGMSEVHIARAESDFRQVLAEKRAVVSDRVPLMLGGATHETRVTHFPILNEAREVTMVGLLIQDTNGLERPKPAMQEANRLASNGRPDGEIAHDLNNVLGTINGYVQFLKEDTDEGSRLKSHADGIATALERGRELVGRLTKNSHADDNVPKTAVRDDTDHEPAEQPLDRSPSQPRLHQHQGRVLVVDDDLDFGDMILVALERAGYECAICHDPAEALDIVKDDPELWDAIVTDQTMPGMTGLQLIDSVKSINRCIVCVLCSGYSATLSESSWRKAGADAFLAKPLQPSALTGLIGHLVRRPSLAE